MYKLLIADDDEWIREGMRRGVQWEQGNIMVVGVAEDGAEAWELIQELKPDILLSDIKMPFIDGLKLAGLIKEQGLDMKIIFLSGYDDFAYAKEALQLQAFDYIMKYEDNEKILSRVISACKELEERRRKVEKEKKSHGLIVNQFLSSLISGTGNEDLIRRESLLLQLSFTGLLFGVAVISLESTGLERFLKPNKPEDLELLLFSIKNLCNEVLESACTDTFQVYVVHYNHRINLLFNSPEIEMDQLRQWAESLAKTIVHSIQKYLKINVQIGIGSFGEGFSQIAFSYEEAMIAAQMKTVMAEQTVIFYDQVKFKGNSHQAYLKIVMNYVKSNYQDVDLDLKKVAGMVHISPSYVSTLFKRYTDINFSDYVLQIRIEKAIELLLHTELKVYEIAEKIGFTNTQYFSVIFKRNAGLSPVEYRQQNRST